MFPTPNPPQRPNFEPCSPSHYSTVGGKIIHSFIKSLLSYFFIYFKTRIPILQLLPLNCIIFSQYKHTIVPTVGLFPWLQVIIQPFLHQNSKYSDDFSILLMKVKCQVINMDTKRHRCMAINEMRGTSTIEVRYNISYRFLAKQKDQVQYLYLLYFTGLSGYEP